MASENDNYADERAFLLAQAQKLLAGCSDHKTESRCSLVEGGPCPLINGAIGALIGKLTPR